MRLRIQEIPLKTQGNEKLMYFQDTWPADSHICQIHLKFCGEIVGFLLAGKGNHKKKKKGFLGWKVNFVN